MQIYSAKSKSVPFPKSDFQKWDVITPKNSENYGKQYTVVDYRHYEFDTGKIEYYYHLISDSGFGEIYERNLDEYEKLYSKKREIALRLQNDLKNKIKSLLEIEENIQKSLDIDINVFNESIEKIKEFIKILEQIR